MKRLKSLCLLSALLAAPAIAPFGAAGAELGKCQTDYAAARREAAANRKDLLIDFGGSDWCELCRKLELEVFRKREFQEAARRPFVLVRIDSPMEPEKKTRIPAAVAARNAALREEFAVRDYPAVFLATADGKPYARTGYRPGGAKAYLRHLDAMLEKKRKRDELASKAESPDCQGLELARTLDEIIENTHPRLAERYHREDMQRIVKLDADNVAGLKRKYQIRLCAMDAGQAMETCHFREAVTLYNTMVTDLKLAGEELQTVLLLKARAYFFLRNSDAMRGNLNDALKAAPESRRAPRIKADLRRLVSEQAENPAPAPAATP